ncbi:MAG: choline dehydrogenase [Alphaproteobacteria bacterium]|jgi:choline dehydrogenase|nr:choline dehydrogenase [Alphaproteobacteria bacterium]
MADWDYIVVGGGSAGCVLAARLSEDPNVKVLLLEAGPRDKSIWIDVPVGFSQLMRGTKFNWAFEMEPEDNVAGRAIPCPRGRTLGGSSSINGMLYVRGQPLDYDTWAQQGNRGWSYDHVLPYFKKSEHYEGKSDDSRGKNGPLNVADMIERHELCDAFIDAAEGMGYPRNPDYNNGKQEGFGYYQTTMKGGKRWSTARAFIDPIRHRPNLDIETDALASRLLLEGKRCVGVAYTVHGREKQAKANREVIVSCGAVQSPQLLELSGIGQPELLKTHGIEVRHELKGVGENYGDHFAPRMNWRVKNKFTLNEQSRGLNLVKEVVKYYTTRRGILTWTAGVVYGFVRTRPGLEGPDMQFHMAHASYGTAATRLLEAEPGMTVVIGQCRPESRGSIHIKSATPGASPAIRPNFLSSQTDRDCTVAGMQIARKILQHPAVAKYIAYENNPGDKVQSYDEWLDFARRTGQTTYHVVGTCKMGSDPMAVVDDRLRVHGLAGLRVIDASIMPTVTSGNTNAPTIMIAEKGADMIKEDAKAGLKVAA